MELLLLASAIAIVIVAFSAAEYLDAKAAALRQRHPDKAEVDIGHKD